MKKEVLRAAHFGLGTLQVETHYQMLAPPVPLSCLLASRYGALGLLHSRAIVERRSLFLMMAFGDMQWFYDVLFPGYRTKHGPDVPVQTWPSQNDSLGLLQIGTRGPRGPWPVLHPGLESCLLTPFLQHRKVEVAQCWESEDEP